MEELAGRRESEMSPTTVEPRVLAQPADRLSYLPFSLPYIGEEEIEAVTECLRSGWITTGPRTHQFEDAFAAAIGVRHAIAVNSCTAALHLALDALEVEPGDEVLVPTMTFAATGEVVIYRGARPVLIDCVPGTMAMDVSFAREYLGRNCRRSDSGYFNCETGGRVRAVIPVHFGGLPSDINALLSLAEDANLDLIEDCAHAFPCHFEGRSVGSFGKAGAFSFYATKNLTTGEGGMLTTDDDQIARRARTMSLHGITRDAWQRYGGEGNWQYDVVDAGFKYNMTDIAAAIGIEQLKRTEQTWEIRNSYAEMYSELLGDLPGVILPAEAGVESRHAWHLYVIRLPQERWRISRDEFIEEMRARRIGTSVHFVPLHMHTVYRERYGYQAQDLPVAARLSKEIVSLPLYARMSALDVERVAEAVRDIAAEFGR